MVKRLVVRVAVVALAASMLACSGGGDLVTDAVDTGSVSTAPATTDGDAASSTRPQPSLEPSGPGGAVVSTAPPSAGVSETGVSETGVPGLDSEDRFCAAWSRFGGSWQVLLVGSTFLGEPERVATWEIASASVIEESYVALIDHFPEELGPETDAVAEGYFGALRRRADASRLALDDAGASPEAVERLGQAWLDALSRRDPSNPDLAFEVPGDLRPLVGRAVDELRSQRVDFHLDPSLVIGVATPLTDVYLDTACPDQGALTGQEVDGS
jgi:hypothetical protein